MAFDPRFLFLSQEHRRKLAAFSFGILSRKNLVVLTGDIGAGKTTLIATTLEYLPKDRAHFSVVSNPSLAPDQVIEMALLNFGVTDIPRGKAQCVHRLNQLFERNDQDGVASVLVFDEAQELSLETLQEIRVLGNMNSLIIILAGQNELNEILNREELESLKQRVCVRLKVEPLPENEVEQYIRHRWKTAGGEQESPFSSGAIGAVAFWSRGVPRLINSLCDNALMAAFMQKSPAVELKHVERAVDRLDLAYSAGKSNSAPEPVTIPSPPAVPAQEPLELQTEPKHRGDIQSLSRFLVRRAHQLMSNFSHNGGSVS